MEEGSGGLSLSRSSEVSKSSVFLPEAWAGGWREGNNRDGRKRCADLPMRAFTAKMTRAYSIHLLNLSLSCCFATDLTEHEWLTTMNVYYFSQFCS